MSKINNYLTIIVVLIAFALGNSVIADEKSSSNDNVQIKETKIELDSNPEVTDKAAEGNSKITKAKSKVSSKKKIAKKIKHKVKNTGKVCPKRLGSRLSRKRC